VGTAALGCPAERRLRYYSHGQNAVELRSAGQPGAAVPARAFL